MRAAAALAIALAAPDGAIDAARLDRTAEAAGMQGVALLGQGDSIVWSRASGEAAPGVPMSVDTVWRLASVTKQLTALIAMQEVAAGRLDLDRPIRDYWPDWPARHAGRITARMLLRHESGLPDPNESRSSANDDVPDFYRRSGSDADPAEAATHFCAGPPRAEPLAGYHYNNCDYIVLGVLLERLTGQSFAALLHDRIAAPLGLKTVGLFDPRADRPRENVPGTRADGRGEPALNLGTYGAAGSGYASAADLWRIDRALMDNSLLDAATTARMWTGDPAIGSAALGVWSYDADVAGCAGQVRVIERRGLIGGVALRNFLVPDRRLALILMTNREAFHFGEVWQGRGFAHDMLAAALCPQEAR
ncbi:MAG: CubicO group peptidase beta-lactamase class family [Sphingomonas bacterium]|nr:serine hydrolase domain-containing protein [Sphingomonas bacterium]MDB5690580.1 CubicO group peptidase beta-lactamase class family [Sphingomonas bacterium]